MKPVKGPITSNPTDVSTTYHCPTPCDPDCDAACHESHLPAFKRDHDPMRCLSYMNQTRNSANQSGGPDA